MKQYSTPSPARTATPVDPRAHARDQAAGQQQIAILENRIQTLGSTVDLQTRQIRRLEAALFRLEAQAVRK